MTWKPPKDQPPLEDLVRMNETLTRILRDRGRDITADPALTMYRVVAIENLLLDLRAVTREQIDYYEAAAEFEELARAERATRPKPRLLIPGRDGEQGMSG